MLIVMAAPVLAQIDTSSAPPDTIPKTTASIVQPASDSAHRPSESTGRGWPAVTLTFFIVLLYGWFFIKYRSRRPVQVPIMSRVPEKAPPALIGYLLNHQVPSRALLATLLDLASRQFITIRIVLSEMNLELNRPLWRKNAVHLEEFEDRVIRFIFGSQDVVSPKDFQAEVFRHFLLRWKRKVRIAGEHKIWFDPGRTAVRRRFQIGAMALFVLSLFLVFKSGAWAILPAALSAAMFRLSGMTSCRSEAGEIRFRQWIAFRQYFQERRYRKAEPQSLIDKIESYILYLPVLDIDPEAFRELFGRIPGFSIRASLPWLIIPETKAHPSETLVPVLIQWLERLSKTDSKKWI
jgi:hypothetical protein